MRKEEEEAELSWLHYHMLRFTEEPNSYQKTSEEKGQKKKKHPNPNTRNEDTPSSMSLAGYPAREKISMLQNINTLTPQLLLLKQYVCHTLF